jgi:hypothetical protein
MESAWNDETRVKHGTVTSAGHIITTYHPSPWQVAYSRQQVQFDTKLVVAEELVAYFCSGHSPFCCLRYSQAGKFN